MALGRPAATGAVASDAGHPFFGLGMALGRPAATSIAASDADMLEEMYSAALVSAPRGGAGGLSAGAGPSATGVNLMSMLSAYEMVLERCAPRQTPSSSRASHQWGRSTALGRSTARVTHAYSRSSRVAPRDYSIAQARTSSQRSGAQLAIHPPSTPVPRQARRAPSGGHALLRPAAPPLAPAGAGLARQDRLAAHQRLPRRGSRRRGGPLAAPGPLAAAGAADVAAAAPGAACCEAERVVRAVGLLWRRCGGGGLAARAAATTVRLLEAHGWAPSYQPDPSTSPPGAPSRQAARLVSNFLPHPHPA